MNVAFDLKYVLSLPAFVISRSMILRVVAGLAISLSNLRRLPLSVDITPALSVRHFSQLAFA